MQCLANLVLYYFLIKYVLLASSDSFVFDKGRVEHARTGSVSIVLPFLSLSVFLCLADCIVHRCSSDCNFNNTVCDILSWKKKLFNFYNCYDITHHESYIKVKCICIKLLRRSSVWYISKIRIQCFFHFWHMIDD